MKKLTVIMPFLNEGEEVYNTLENIRRTSGNRLEILLINDASDDGRDEEYRRAAQQFDARYRVHPVRRGVAASRDEAVEICPTDYFILLDAHMRMFLPDWDLRIVDELEKDPRTLLCCQSIAMEKDEQGNSFISPNKLSVYGAYIDFGEKSHLMASWNVYDPDPDRTEVEVPCVMGAGYACNTAYWKYLHGLEGLRSYGMDEQLISLKVWMEGGTCRILKDFQTGHVYRKTFPYKNDSDDLIYNKLYLAQLFLPPREKYQVFRGMESFYPDSYRRLMQELSHQKKWLQELQTYYRQIFTRSIEDYIAYNGEIQSKSEALLP